MYKANIYLKFCQKKHAYAAPCPEGLPAARSTGRGANTQFPNFKFINHSR